MRPSPNLIPKTQNPKPKTQNPKKNAVSSPAHAADSRRKKRWPGDEDRGDRQPLSPDCCRPASGRSVGVSAASWGGREDDRGVSRARRVRDSFSCRGAGTKREL